MRKYAQYKDSGISWIGDVPEHWLSCSLRKYLSFVSDKGHPDEQLLSVTREQGVIIRNKESKEENHNFIPEDLSGYKLVKKGQFAINKMKSWQGSYAVSEYTGIVSPAYYICDLRFEYKPFFNWAIRSKAYIPFFTMFSKGIRVDQWDLSPIGLKSIPFFEPPLSEQKAIAEYLDKKTAQINELVSAKQKQIELLKEYKQSVIANAVTGKIDEINDTRRFSTLVELSSMRRTGSRPTDERREKINWIGYIPRHWQKRKFQYLFKERSEKNHPEEPVLCATQSRGVIPQSMYENRVVVVNTGFDGLKFVKKGDFVISLRSFQGGIEYAYYQGIISAAYTILYINTKDLYSDYVRLLFKSVPFIGLLQTCVTGIREGQNINNDLLRKQIIPVPPLSEQKEIVAYIEKKVSSIDSQIASIENQIANLNEYKQSLISDVVTGKVKV